MNTIYYGISTRPTAGGHHVNVQHVQELRKQGLRVYLLYWPSGSTIERFRTTAPVLLFTKRMVFHPDDIVVLPEGWRIPLEYFSTQPCRKILHCQNPFYLFNGVNDIQQFSLLKIESAISCSEFTRETMRRLGFLAPIQVVRPYLNQVFNTDAECSITRKLQVAYMPRKMPAESLYVQGLFKSLYPEHANIPWIPIQGKSIDECAEILRQSAIFASFSHLEGLGLPPLEAMSSGCIVAGYHGHGGKEYINNGNGYWVDSGNHEGFAHAINNAVNSLKMSNNNRTMATNMKNTVAQYTYSSFQKNLMLAWRNLLGAKYENFLLGTS